MNKEDGLDLYIKVACSVCLEGHREGMFLNCPYCDIDRKQIIQVSFNTLKKILKEKLTITQKEKLMKLLEKNGH